MFHPPRGRTTRSQCHGDLREEPRLLSEGTNHDRYDLMKHRFRNLDTSPNKKANPQGFPKMVTKPTTMLDGEESRTTHETSWKWKAWVAIGKSIIGRESREAGVFKDYLRVPRRLTLTGVESPKKNQHTLRSIKVKRKRINYKEGKVQLLARGFECSSENFFA